MIIINNLNEFKKRVKNSTEITRYGTLTLEDLNKRWKELESEIKNNGIGYEKLYKPLNTWFGKPKCPCCGSRLNNTQMWSGDFTYIKYIIYCNNCNYEYPNKVSNPD